MTDIQSSLVPSLLAKDPPILGPPDKPRHDEKSLHFQDIGVWTIMQDVKIPRNLPALSRWKLNPELLEVLPVVLRFIQECLSVGPWTVFVYFLTSMWSGTEAAVSLYFSSRILDIIQKIIVDREVDPKALVIAVFSRVVFTLASCIVTRARDTMKSTLAIRVRYIFEERLIQANLRLDFPTFEEPETASKVNKLFGYGLHGGAWDIFEDLIHRFQGFASVTSQIGFLVGVLSTHPGGRWFALLCVGKSIVDRFMSHNLWNEISYVWDSNPHYRRMTALLSMITRADHRIEIVSNVVGKHIQQEWSKARKLLGDLSDDFPETVLYLQRPLMSFFFAAISDDFPLMFYAYQVLRSPTSFSLTSVALMQQASTSLGYTISSIMNMQQSLQQRCNDIRNLYDCSEIPNKVLDGESAYPQKDSKNAAGMEITFQNVSFAYPHADNVINDVSFTIGSGKTVIIVGVNGSGKSTLLKLFNRLYDPAAGSVLVDGVPMTSFNCADLRRASAMLFQKFTHYPLSVRENIILGRPDGQTETDRDEKSLISTQNKLVEDAARLGGSLDFIREQSEGFDTILQPRISGYSTSARKPSEPFKKMVKDINKRVDVSSGQWQRLALSRLLYRAAGEEIKLVAVDEPSASLDPKMEYELFDSLRDLSTTKGRTVVFVTHRFGYLTKRADLILVMQKGRLVEQGKHEDLLQMGGEYAKLYNLQAKAFLPS